MNPSEASPSFADLFESMGRALAGQTSTISGQHYDWDTTEAPLRGLAIDNHIREIAYVPPPVDAQRAANLNTEWLDTERQIGAAYSALKRDLSHCRSKRAFEAARAKFRATCKSIMEQGS